MPQYTVFYAHDIPPLKWPPATPKVFVAGDYLEVGTFDAPSIGAVYSSLQDPEDERLHELCAEAGVHTTMTMGDVVRDESGALWMCAFQGWYQMEHEEQHPITEEDKRRACSNPQLGAPEDDLPRVPPIIPFTP